MLEKKISLKEILEDIEKDKNFNNIKEEKLLNQGDINTIFKKKDALIQKGLIND